MYKKVLIFFFFLVLVNPIFANRLDDIQTTGILKAGVSYDFEPFSYKTTDGRVVGFDIDLLNYIADKLNLKLVIKKVTLDNQIKQIIDAKVDIVSSIVHTVSADIDIDFTISYFFDGQTLLTRKNIRTKKLRGFNGKKIGAIKGNSSGSNFKKYIPKARMIYYTSYDEALRDVLNGTLDAMTTNSVWCIAQAKHNKNLKVINEKISLKSYGMGLAENESDFRDAINFALQESVLDGTYTSLYKKWFQIDPDILPEVWH